VFCSWDAHPVLTDLSTLIGSYRESIIPIAYFHQPELKVLHEVGCSSVCTMNVPNYYERNLRSCASANMKAKCGVLFSDAATHSTHGLFFLVSCSSLNHYRLCALRPASGDDNARVTLV